MRRGFVCRLLFVCLLMLWGGWMGLSAQKVGLVLSGGGAKGCTHIGVIRALEEEGIPIDYVAGTSMGAIVSSLYAMGYSPDQMASLILSDKFMRWQSGNIDERNLFFFKRDDPTPEFISFKVNVRDSSRAGANFLIPSSVLPPDQLNIAFMDLFSKANAACRGNFDSLFVPFRCVASDVAHKCAYVHRNGDLGDAVRTSMSFPFVFRPIQVNGLLMLDGGIYNNFPVDVMEEDFHPDFIIGCAVSDNPSLDSKNPSSPVALLEKLIMDETNYKIPEEKGILIDFHFTDVGLLDFNRMKELEKLGYDSTKAMIQRIKERVTRRVELSEVEKRREEFMRKEKELVFGSVNIRGVNSVQRNYLLHNFSPNKEDSVLDLNSFQKVYFKLLSDEKISEIVPHAYYNDSLGNYDLHLDVKMNSDFEVLFGGNISSTAANNLFLGVQKRGVHHFGYNVALDGQIGSLYKDVHMQARLDRPGRVPIGLKVMADYCHINYLNKQEPFYENDIKNNISTEAYTSEFYGKVKMMVPFNLKGKLDIGFGYGHKDDHYHYLPDEKNKWNETNYNLGIALLQYKHNSLSHKQYPLDGMRISITAQYIFGSQWTKKYKMDESGFMELNRTGEEGLHWIQLSYNSDNYFNLGKRFSLGVYFDGVFSMVPMMDNYMQTLLISPMFTPSKHNKFVFNSAFCSSTYWAGGLGPIYKFNKVFHLRFENYAYLPYRAFALTGSYRADYRPVLSKLYFFNELTFVADLKFISAAFYVNRYSYPEKNWNFGLNIGYLLFHDRMIEK